MAVATMGPVPSRANPYLSKPGEPPAKVRAATCALSGGFIHLYAALDNGLFEKYGVKVEFVSIRGSVVCANSHTEEKLTPSRPHCIQPAAGLAQVRKSLAYNDKIIA